MFRTAKIRAVLVVCGATGGRAKVVGVVTVSWRARTRNLVKLCGLSSIFSARMGRPEGSGGGGGGLAGGAARFPPAPPRGAARRVAADHPGDVVLRQEALRLGDRLRVGEGNGDVGEVVL